MILALLALLACAPDPEPPDGKPSRPGDTAVEDTGRHDTAEPVDTGPCPTEYVELELPAACDERLARADTTYALSDAALRVAVSDYNAMQFVQLTPDIGGDGAPDLVIAPSWHASDTYSVWVLDASRRGAATTADAWFSLHWSRLDYGYTLAAATYAPGFFPEDALIVKAGEAPTSWYSFRAPLVPGLELEDADLVVVGRASGRANAADQTDVVPAGDLDGDGLSELLFPAPQAGEIPYVGWYEGRVYVVPGASTGVLTLDDVTDWVGGTGFSDCESWDLSYVEPLGDVNGDGYDDLVIAGRSDLSSGGNAAWIVHGPFSGARDVSDAAARLDGDSFYNGQLESGDFDGDGKPDLAITDRTPVVDLGADGALETADDLAIAAWVHYGPFDGVRQVGDGVGLLPTVGGGYAGVWMEADDFDGDGFDDLLTSEFTQYDTEGYNLLAWGPFCETGGASRGAVRFTPEPDFDGLLGGVASGPDVDGDGLPELVVTARGSDWWTSATYLVLSSDLPTAEPGP